MNSNILFTNDEVESVTINGESIYFSLEGQYDSLWSVGDDGYEDENVLSELGIYNIQ